MKRDDDLGPNALPPHVQVELTLARIENSRAFRRSARHRALLRHMVDRTLAGDVGALKESVIAIEVFGRRAAEFDPRVDSIVRVETRRLRARLSTYERTEGRDAPVRIELPVGSYVPLIAARSDMPHPAEATRRARDLVERGTHFLRQPLSEATLEAARLRFDEALRESPSFAPACVGLARAWLNLALGWYRAPAVAADHAGEALQRALELDPDDATAHALLGTVKHQFDADWPAARRHLTRAVALAPDVAFVHTAYGCQLIARGDGAGAERELLTARRLDPQYVNARMHMVNLRLLQRRAQDAQAELEALHDLAPASMAVTGMRGLLALLRGEADAAVDHYRQAVALAPDHPNAHVSLAAALGAAGRRDEAGAVLAAWPRHCPGRLVSPYVLAVAATHCGRLEEAVALLQRARAERDPSATLMTQDPSFDALRRDPRWSALVAPAS